MADNLSAVLIKQGEIQIKQMPVPEKPGDNEVILASHSVGICGTDVSFWLKGKLGGFICDKPMILGHETSATVVEVGKNVTNVAPGDRVAVEPGVPCRYCEFCKIGKYNLCTKIVFVGLPPGSGSITRLFKHQSDFCYKLPENVSCEEGTLMEPLSVAVHACNRAQITVGDNVLICGAGPIGLVSMLSSRAYGAANTIVTDINEERLKFAKSLGATHTVHIKPENTAEELASNIEKLIGVKPNISIECTGVESSLKLAIYATKSGGSVVLVGLGPAEVKVPLVDAACREIDIKGAFAYRNCYQQSLELISSGKVNVKPLITHRYPLEETIQAFEKAKSGEAIKVLIRCCKD